MANILIIEDEPAPRKLMSVVLQRAGHAVRQAASREEAVAAVRDFTPDLLLSDWLLVEDTGYDVALAVREHAPDVRALFITGFPPETVHEQARELSPWPILEKPLDVDVLVASVRKALDAEEATRAGPAPRRARPPRP